MPASKRTTCRRKKTASRKKSASRSKTAPRKTCSRSRTLSRRKTASRSCGLSRSRTVTGACGPRAPCIDEEGNVMRFATRGSDGNCRVRSCGSGYIMNPKTGTCVTTSNSYGKELALKKKYDDARRFAESYEAAYLDAKDKSSSAQYYDQFDMKTYMENQRARNKAAFNRDAEYRARALEQASARKTHADEWAQRQRTLQKTRSGQGIVGKQGIFSRAGSYLFG